MSCALPRRLVNVSSAFWTAPQVGTHSTLFLTQLWIATGLRLSAAAWATMAALRVASGVGARSASVGIWPGSGGIWKLIGPTLVACAVRTASLPHSCWNQAVLVAAG